MLTGPPRGLFFYTYEKLRTHLSAVAGAQLATSVAAGAASVITKTAVFPFDLVRKRLQVQGPTRSVYGHRNIPKYAGIAATMRAVVRGEGVRGLYKGLTVSLVKAAPLSAATLWSLEGSIRLLDWLDPPADSREA